MEFQCVFFFLQSRHELEILLAKWELVQFIYWKRMKSMLKMESIIIIIVLFGVHRYVDKPGLKAVAVPPASASQMPEVQAYTVF